HTIGCCCRRGSSPPKRVDGSSFPPGRYFSSIYYSIFSHNPKKAGPTGILHPPFSIPSRNFEGAPDKSPSGGGEGMPSTTKARPPKWGQAHPWGAEKGLDGSPSTQDRKSTRLNSSHVKISYAVFC